MKRFFITNVFCFLTLIFSAQGQVKTGKRDNKEKGQHKAAGVKPKRDGTYFGVASYYADKFKGRLTASGSAYSHKALSAACNVLPLGTWIKVTNLRNAKSVIVKVNDRLHHANTRLVDLTKACADKLGYINRGLAKVKMEVLAQEPSETALAF